MRERFARFMYGRNGFDDLNRFLSYAALILLIISFFTVRFLWYIALALLIFTYFRAFSRDLYRRRRENEGYVRLKYKFFNLFTGKARDRARNKGYKIFKCPTCKQKIRIPKHKGRIEISCPKCRTKFIRVS